MKTTKKHARKPRAYRVTLHFHVISNSGDVRDAVSYVYGCLNERGVKELLSLHAGPFRPRKGGL